MASTPVTAPTAPSPDSSTPSTSSSNSSSSTPHPESSPPSPSPPPSSPPPQSQSPPPPKSTPPSSSEDSPSPPAPSEDDSTPAPPPPMQTDKSSSPPSQSTFFTPPSKPSRSGSSAPPLSPLRTNNGDKSLPSSSRMQKASPAGDSSSAHVDTPLVIAVVTGIGIFILIILISALVCCCCKKKKKKHAMHYYDPSASKGNDYYNNVGGVLPSKRQPQGAEQNIKVPPPPGMMMMPQGGGGGWVPPPPAPFSGNMSSSYSGPQTAVLPPPSPNIALGFNKSNFTYDELAAATGCFSQVNLLGQGGFGYVYKGYLPNGKEVAVKQLKSGSGQGEKEFQAEVEIISRVHHRHLVSLVGYCIAGAQRMLVYEFVPNNTLEHHLHGKGLPTMTWPTRLKIAIGSAKGFAYLHEDCHPRIIHRDIKAANILLDYKFEAMVADFGLAKLSSDTNTHVSTRIMGTFGYLAPEYASSGKLTDRSDVFSFGVMLLELITGRRPIDHNCDDSLVDWARPIMTEALAEGNFDEIADPKLEGNYNPQEMARMVACAAAAVRHSARRRPKMSQIVRALEGDGSLDDLNDGGVKPGQSMFFSSGSDYDMGSYSNNMRQFRKVALASGEFSEEYSGPTSEYGLNPSESSGSSGEMHSGTRGHKPQRQV